MRSIFLSLAIVVVATGQATAASPMEQYEMPQVQQQAKPRPFRLVTEKWDTYYRHQLPAVESDSIREMFDDPRLMFYTEREIPDAYQHWVGDLQGVHSPSYNISADNGEPHGNGNIEFPWGAPAGTHRTNNVKSFRFLWLPIDSHGRTRPVVWFRKRLQGDSSIGYAWRFPVGAVVGEVLQMRGPGGVYYPFEIRMRTREHGDWAVEVLRPFPTAKDLAARIKELRPQWKQNKTLARLVSYLDNPVKLKPYRLADSQPMNGPFRQWMGVDSLPPVGDNELVVDLLRNTPFKSALGEKWRTSPSGYHTFAPTTRASFHIVPAHYDGGFIEADRVSCRRCHQTVNQSVDRFNFSRDWYGRIRGSDGIFSFHPFARSSISYSGFGGHPTIRSDMTSAGIIAKYNPQRHPRSVYHQVSHFRE